MLVHGSAAIRDCCRLEVPNNLSKHILHSHVHSTLTRCRASPRRILVWTNQRRKRSRRAVMMKRIRYVYTNDVFRRFKSILIHEPVVVCIEHQPHASTAVAWYSILCIKVTTYSYEYEYSNDISLYWYSNSTYMAPHSSNQELQHNRLISCSY